MGLPRRPLTRFAASLASPGPRHHSFSEQRAAPVAVCIWSLPYIGRWYGMAEYLVDRKRSRFFRVSDTEQLHNQRRPLGGMIPISGRKP